MLDRQACHRVARLFRFLEQPESNADARNAKLAQKQGEHLQRSGIIARIFPACGITTLEKLKDE